MPKYHFTLREEYDRNLPDTRISTLFERGRDKIVALQRTEFFDNGVKQITIGNAQGSLFVVDRTMDGLNKIHIGELIMRNPHVEVKGHSGKEGPREDLKEWDITYSRLRLQELEKWRDPEYREMVRDKYRASAWYTAKPRIRQLNISAAGLERQIIDLQRHIDELDGQPGNTYFSEASKVIESQCEEITREINLKVDSGLVKSPARKDPKMAYSPALIDQVRQVTNIIHSVFDRLAQLTDQETIEKYWERVGAWEKL
jgi:hypothetical protein